jgi:hypothetical protein
MAYSPWVTYSADKTLPAGIESFANSMNEAAAQAVKARQESQFLGTMFDSMKSQRAKYGMSGIDPETEKKFVEGSMTQKRAIVSSLGTESQVAMQAANLAQVKQQTQNQLVAMQRQEALSKRETEREQKIAKYNEALANLPPSPDIEFKANQVADLAAQNGLIGDPEVDRHLLALERLASIRERSSSKQSEPALPPQSMELNGTPVIFSPKTGQFSIVSRGPRVTEQDGQTFWDDGKATHRIPVERETATSASTYNKIVSDAGKDLLELEGTRMKLKQKPKLTSDEQARLADTESQITDLKAHQSYYRRKLQGSPGGKVEPKQSGGAGGGISFDDFKNWQGK